jgi:hypothetical protein
MPKRKTTDKEYQDLTKDIDIVALQETMKALYKTVDPKRGIADARRNATFEPNYLRGLLSRLFAGKC